VPEPILYSILYPVMAEPPLLDGVDQERLICVDEACVATSPVGDPGAVDAEDDDGVAEASPDAVPVPAEDIAETL
jgi:hypothetical protein